MEDNKVSVFKSFLREQTEHLEELEKVLEGGDLEKAKEIVKKMLKRNQEGIEDD